MSSKFANWKSDDKAFLSTILATVVFKCIIQGLLFVAAWRYFSNNGSRDGIKLRAFVGVVLVLEVVHTAISIAKMHLVAIDHVFWKTHWLSPTDTMLNGIICFMAQVFFGQRCWRVTNKSTLILCLVILSISIVFVGDIGVIVNEWLAYSNILCSIPLLRAFIYVWGFSSIVLEVLVTTTLIRFLWDSRTGIRGLDQVILHLFTISIESSAPCLVFLFLLNLTVLLKNVSANFFAYSTASLYGLSLMWSLNCRDKIQDKLVQYRREGAVINFSEPSQPGEMTESQLFSEAGITSRHASTAVGSNPDPYRRPSIMSFVKEVL